MEWDKEKEEVEEVVGFKAEGEEEEDEEEVGEEIEEEEAS